MRSKPFQFFFIFIFLFSWQATGYCANLIEVYQQALASDPVYQQAISQRLATQQGVPLSVAEILPHAEFNITPALTRTGYSGTALAGTNNFSISPRNNTARTYTMRLTIAQTIFDFAKFYKIAGEAANAKAADAALNAALQNLMVRTANAYFAVLKDEDNLIYAEASKIAFAEQLDQMKQQFSVGVKTITDIYTAQASYDLSLASYIAAQTELTNDKENLHAITGFYYPTFDALSEKFPLILPEPANSDAWVKTAYRQNWAIKAQQYAVENAKQTIKQKFSGHLPTVEIRGTMDRLYALNINAYTRLLLERNGPGTQTDRQVELNVHVPILSGGATIAQTKEATYHYQSAQQQLEKTVRDTVNATRQSYLNILAGVSKIKADKEAVKSVQSSAEGLEESYRIGAETLVDVLNQQQKVYQAQTAYAADKYAFVTNIIALKQAAGTLSFEDLQAINQWLIPRKKVVIRKKPWLQAGKFSKKNKVKKPPVKVIKRTANIKQ